MSKSANMSFKSTRPSGLIPKKPKAPLLPENVSAQPLFMPEGLNQKEKLPSKPRSRKNRKSLGAKRNRQAKQHAKNVQAVRGKRNADLRDRDATLHVLGGPVEPLLQFKGLLGDPEVQCPEVTEFYRNSGNYVRLSDDGEVNVSNPDGIPGGGRGVFADRDIPAFARLCPYIGKTQSERCAAEQDCHYCLQLSSDYVVCAREVPYDMGWMLCDADGKREDAVRAERAAEPNLGRYFNSVRDPESPEVFNSKFEATEDGRMVCFLVSTRAVKKGEELLVDYRERFAW